MTSSVHYISVYNGGMERGLPHGNGCVKWDPIKTTDIARFQCSSSYEGQFQHGERHGSGTYTYSDGSLYEGPFLNNEKHGDGTYIFADGMCVNATFPVDNRLDLRPGWEFWLLPDESLNYTLSDFYLGQEDEARVREFVLVHLVDMKALYIEVKSIDRMGTVLDRLCMTLDQLWSFLESTGIVRQIYPLAMVNRVICRSEIVKKEMSNPINKNKTDIHSGTRRMFFRHFVEALLRVAIDTSASVQEGMDLIAGHWFGWKKPDGCACKYSHMHFLSSVENSNVVAEWETVSVLNNPGSPSVDRTVTRRALAGRYLGMECTESGLDEELIFDQFVSVICAVAAKEDV